MVICHVNPKSQTFFPGRDFLVARSTLIAEMCPALGEEGEVQSWVFRKATLDWTCDLRWFFPQKLTTFVRGVKKWVQCCSTWASVCQHIKTEKPSSWYQVKLLRVPHSKISSATFSFFSQRFFFAFRFPSFMNHGFWQRVPSAVLLLGRGRAKHHRLEQREWAQQVRHLWVQLPGWRMKC